MRSKLERVGGAEAEASEGVVGEERVVLRRIAAVAAEVRDLLT